jgi:hypothetical protein
MLTLVAPSNDTVSASDIRAFTILQIINTWHIPTTIESIPYDGKLLPASLSRSFNLHSYQNICIRQRVLSMLYKSFSLRACLSTPETLTPNYDTRGF